MKIDPSKKLKQFIVEVTPRIQPRMAAALLAVAQKLPAVRLKKILATTDFSASSQVGVRCARAFAKKLDAAIELVYVVEPVVCFAGGENILLALDDSAVIEQAGKDLDKIAQRQSKPDFPVASVVKVGKPFHEIATLARNRQTDLIVISTRGHTGLKRALLGSTAERVVRHAPCPVLTVPSQIPGERVNEASVFRLKKILVPIDFSETSAQALPYAAAMARQFDAEIILLHVVEPLLIPAGLGYMRSGVRDTDRNSEQIAKTNLHCVSEEFFGESDCARIMARTGAPHREITAAAKELGADLIVLTTHGYTGLKHVLLGSTAEQVVRHADCPVMVVRRTERGVHATSTHKPQAGRHFMRHCPSEIEAR
jgi:nucleotide-binding universal stress UspA family protein